MHHYLFTGTSSMPSVLSSPISVTISPAHRSVIWGPGPHTRSESCPKLTTTPPLPDMWGDLTRGTTARSTAPAGRNVDKTIQFGKCGNTSGCPLRYVSEHPEVMSLHESVAAAFRQQRY